MLHHRRVRLAAYLRAAGASRTRREACLDLLQPGRVLLNGSVQTDGTALVQPGEDVVVLDGRAIEPPPPLHEARLWRYHKPCGLVVSHTDPASIFATASVAALGGQRNVQSVGRLDLPSEGLMLLTDSSELARHCEHPSTGLMRSYAAQVASPSGEAAQVPSHMMGELAAGALRDGSVVAPIAAAPLPGAPCTAVHGARLRLNARLSARLLGRRSLRRATLPAGAPPPPPARAGAGAGGAPSEAGLMAYLSSVEGGGTDGARGGGTDGARGGGGEDGAAEGVLRWGAPTWLELSLAEGKKHEVRKALAAYGLGVLRLVRLRFGPLDLGELGPGQVQEVAGPPLEALRQSAVMRRRREEG